MKKLFTLMLCAAALASACSDDTDDFTKRRAVVSFEGAEWSNFVATNSYSGNVMTEDYVWEDAVTSLSSRPVFPESSYGSYYGGGATISNYCSGDIQGKGSYEYDLYVYNTTQEDGTTGGGAAGSDNFLVFYGNFEEDLSGAVDCRPSIFFSDGKPREIKSCMINATTYFVNIVENGNAFSPKLAEGDKVEVLATGFDIRGEQTAVARFCIAEYGSTTKSWQEWDLSSLGNVVRVQFNILGGPVTEWGMTTPKYFALDDIVVEWFDE